MQETSEQLENNPKLRHLLPPGNLDRLWNKREIRLSTGTVIRARGWGVRVRGGHPQAIVCDDILTDDHLYSETQRGRATDYFFSVPSNMITPEGQLIVCGTPFHFADVYKKIENTKKYAVSTYPAKDPKGRALFPERYSEAALASKEQEIGTARFAREFMCKPLTDEASLFPSKLFAGDIRLPYNLGMGYKYWHERGFMLYTGMDIAMSAESGSDYTVVFTIATNLQGERWIANIRRHRGLGYDDQISLLEEEYALMRFEVAYVEANQAQRLIPEGAVRRTGIPIRKFFTLGVQPKKDWNKGMTTLSAGKHHLDRGVPSLRLSLENRKWRIPRGDPAGDPQAAAYTVEMTDIWIGEMQCISYQDGKVVSVGEHDDTCMACWMCDSGVRLGGSSFVFGDDRQDTEMDQVAQKEMHGIPAMPRMAGAPRGEMMESDILVSATMGNAELDPEMLESTVKQLPGPPVHLVRKGGQPQVVNGCYILRVEGDPGFYRYALDKQGYGEVVNVEVRAMQAPGADGTEGPGTESFDPFGLGEYLGEDDKG
jgi:hypothetical protein